MRERDLQLNLKDQKELNRIKTILFPKKQTNLQVKRQPLAPKVNNDNGITMRSQIDKLRGEITSLLSKGKGNDILSNHTEKAYLDGINKLSKDLKYNASDINQVFDEFLAHLPTKFVNEVHHYTTHYYYSMLVQNVVWDKIQNLMKRPVIEAFISIKQESESKKEMQMKIESIDEERKARLNLRNYSNLGKYFSKWRLNNKCIKSKIEAQYYLKENNIENDQKLIQNLLNFPLLVLMLEQLGLQACDMSEILVLDERKGKACKFIEQGQSMVNSSLETVTQRSLLQSQRPNLKFSRFDINLTASLTKQCVEKGQILFIDTLSKSLDYSQIDNLCYWQSLSKSNPQCLKGGAIFYPIFDINQECIGILRQYFYQGGIKAINSKKLQKICVFLELGMNMDKRMRLISKQKEYQREGYYMKMIEMVKKLQVAQGSEKDLISKLSEQLQLKFKISKLTIYRIESNQEDKLKDILLKKIWGDGDDGNYVLTLVHQLLKQHSNYIYLQNRLVVYSNMMLFDLKITQNVYSDGKEVSLTERNLKNLLPIELIVSTLTKVQAILSTKQKQNTQIQLQLQREQEKLKKQENHQLQSQFEAQSLKFISSMSKNEVFTIQIERYIQSVHRLINKLTFSQKTQFKQTKFYLQCQFSNSKRDKFILSLEQVHREATEQEKIFLGQMMKIRLNDFMALYCDVHLQKQGKVLFPLFAQTIMTFTNKFISQAQIKQKKCNFKQLFNSFMNKELPISSHPSKQQKRQWQKHELTLIYQNFKEAVDKFLQYSFACSSQSTWVKQKPNDKNFQDWKQSLYKLVLSNPQNITFSITNKNRIISVKECNQIKSLTNYSFGCISQQSTLVISVNKPIYRPKNAVNDNNVSLTLPIYFYLDQHQQESIITSNLDELKSLLVMLCQNFINGANTFNNNIKLHAATSIFNRYFRYQMEQKKQFFAKMKKQSSKVLNQQRLWKKFVSYLDQFQLKMKSKSFLRLCSYSEQMHFDNRNKIYCYENISKFSLIISQVLFKQAFCLLQSQANRFLKIKKLIHSVNSFIKNHQKSLIMASLLDLDIYTRKTSKVIIFNEIFNALRANQLFYSFRRVKSIRQQKIIENVYFNQIEKCRTLEEIKSKISEMVPKYSLFLQFDQDQCYTIYSVFGQHYKQCQTMQSTYNPPNGLISYQCGSEGQLIWNYHLNKDQNCFKIKDRLNSLGKCIQLGIKNCKKVMGISLLKCSMFHRSCIKRTKSNMFKRWILQTQHTEMLQRNRLNDSLYQISIQTQTIKQKLKCQDKIIKNHHSQYQQLLKKQQEYKHSISLNHERIEAIDQNQGKLESAKSVYSSLHRRGTIKTIFLLWRKNASAVTLSQAKRLIKSNMATKRIAFNTIAQIVSTKRREYLREFICKIWQTKKQVNFRPKDIQKIEVMFQDRGNRLITFQSQFQQLQNSYRHSNRQLEQTQLNYSKRIFDRQRSPLQRIELSEQEYSRFSNGAYKLNPKTLKFLKRMGKLQT